MDARNEDSAEKLFERFGDVDHAREYAEDIRHGERIFAEHGVPKVEEELLARIKAQVNTALQSRNKTGLRPIVYRLAAVLAIIGVLSIGVFLRNHNGTSVESAQPGVPAVLWDSRNIIEDDADLATLTAEVEQLQGELVTLQLGDGTSSRYGEVDDLEVELMDIDSDFWEG